MTTKAYRWAVLILATATWVIPTAAHALPFGPEQEEAWREAQAFWGVAAPPLCTSLTREVVAPEVIAGDSGRATVPVQATECQVWIREDLEPPCLLRGVVTHEFGHLLGLPHNKEPHSIMNPTNSEPYCEAEQAAKAAAFAMEGFLSNKNLAVGHRERCPTLRTTSKRRTCWWEYRGFRQQQRVFAGEWREDMARAELPILP